MNRPLVRKIRKLLQLAKNNGPEALLAKDRANELMEKHGIVVTLDDTVRVPMHGVGGVFWREQLLFVLGRTFRCRLLSSTTGNEVVLAGEREDVDKALHAFTRLSLSMIVKCHAEWLDFLRQQSERDEDEYYDYDDDDDDETEALHDPIVVAAWYKFYLESAVRTLLQRFAPPKEADKPPAGLNVPVREKPVDKKVQKKIVQDTSNKLEELLGWRAEELINSSRQLGARSVDGARIEEAKLPMFPIVSTVPLPPPPTRFTYLEVD